MPVLSSPGWRSVFFVLFGLLGAIGVSCSMDYSYSCRRGAKDSLRFADVGKKM